MINGSRFVALLVLYANVVDTEKRARKTDDKSRTDEGHRESEGVVVHGV